MPGEDVTKPTPALDLIEAAFADRRPPEHLTDSLQLLDFEYDEVMSFADLRWQDLSFDQIDKNADALFWFSPEAFCFFLPGFLSAGLKENRWQTNAYDSILTMLDRSPEPAYWDDFFQPRWTRLTVAELQAVAAWLNWLATVDPDTTYANTYDRARVTLTLLAEHRTP